ncbi:MAG: alpha-L-fucosidase, partial [Spirochaetia bacterium]|nr:alpha-L-fucosidase [Spirochaetia bacterium]
MKTATRTKWFRDAKWGIFFHYLASPASGTKAADMTPEEWNRRIEAFDVNGLAAQLEALRAGYFFITLGQNSGYYLSPNKTYDAILNRKTSRLSKRDLVADLASALGKRGIRLMVYFTCLGPAQDLEALEALKCTPPWKPHCALASSNYKVQPEVDDRLTEFQNNWQKIIGEWSMRWAKNVSGWWFDGGYYADKLYLHPDAPNFDSFFAAVRSGNPDSLIAVNPGVKVPVIKHAPDEDYTGGEIADAFPIGVNAGDWSHPIGGMLEGAQYHLLSFLGGYWGRGEPRLSEELLVAYTNYINAAEGVMTWDVPPTETGLIPENFMVRLRAMGK